MLDIVTAQWALKKSKKYTDDSIAAIIKGMEYKGSVSTYSNLPITGNKIGYVYTVSDTHAEYVWPLDAASGSVSDWEILGGITVAQLAEKMEGSDILSADENEGGTKVRIGFDMTGASAGDVPMVNASGTGVEWGTINVSNKPNYVEVYSLTITLANATASDSNPAYAYVGASYIFTAANGYKFTNASLSGLTGATGTWTVSTTTTTDDTATLTLTAVTGNVSCIVSGVSMAHTIVVTGYGSQAPSSVSWVNNGVSLDFEEVTVDGNIFIKIPTMYRKIDTVSGAQITGFTIADGQVDSSYLPYSCFVDEDDNILPYILIGKYCSTSSSVATSVSGSAVSMTPSAGRTLCRNKGTGYLMYDWQIHKLWQDLICAKMQTININSGAGITQDSLGIYHQQNGSYVYPWVDGVNTITASNKWAFSRYPSKYVDNATGSTDGYQEATYTHPAASGVNITSLGYDSTDDFSKFFSFPMAASGSSYTVYYCDAFYRSTSNATYPVRSYVGYADAYYGAFHCNASASWSDSRLVRLCYRPLAS